MKDLIEQLKNNEKAFSRMTDEMQTKALTIKKDNFSTVNDRGEWVPATMENAMAIMLGAFEPKHVYRLEQTYTEPVEDEYEMLTTKDFTDLEEAEEAIPTAVSEMCKIIRRQHDELVRLRHVKKGD